MKVTFDKVNFEGFSINRFWGGKLFHILVWRYLLVLDFRKDWVKDMAGNSKNESR